MCVGKTFCVYHRANQLWKHPHVCGEDTCWRIRRTGAAETPPRAWGRRLRRIRHRHVNRNTPTCVGKTGKLTPGFGLSRKHPHVRGEDDFFAAGSCKSQETPPRAWGRQLAAQSDRRVNGNTPTCVGKTQRNVYRTGGKRKHPHVRGEDPPWTAPGYQPAETPPRAWGRHSGYVMAWVDPGNTPTCVGKTENVGHAIARREKHPHVRGEDLAKNI